MITYDTPAWRGLQGRFAMPEKVEALKQVQLAPLEVLSVVDALHEVERSIKAALTLRIEPVFAQSVEGANAERDLQDALFVLRHLIRQDSSKDA